MTGVHATEQRLDQAVDDLVAEPGGDQLADGDVLAVGHGSPAVSWRSRSTPASLSTPEPATCSTSAGTPITERGIGRSAPLVQTDDEVVAGWTTSQPELLREVDALGPARQHRLGPEVDPDPRDLAGEQLAADARTTLEHDHLAARGGQVAGGRQARDAAAPRRTRGGAGTGPLWHSHRDAWHRPRNQTGHGVPSYAHAHHSPPRGLGHRPAALPHGLLRRVRRPRATTADDSGGDVAAGWTPAAGGPRTGRPPTLPRHPPRTPPAPTRRAPRATPCDLTTEQALIKTGAVALRSDDVGETRYDVQVLVDEHGGQVADDKTETDKSGEPLRSRMVLRVPVDDFDEVMDALAEHGHPGLDHHQLGGRHDPAHRRRGPDQGAGGQRRAGASAARPGPSRSATSWRSRREIANRQAQLDSLAQQQAYLAGPDLDGDRQGQHRAQARPEEGGPQGRDDSGFLAGLAAGWNGLKSTVVAVATVVGAVLPFAGVALLLGVPVWLLVRRMRRTPASPLPRRAVTSGSRVGARVLHSASQARDADQSGRACTNRVSSSS